MDHLSHDVVVGFGGNVLVVLVLVVDVVLVLVVVLVDDVVGTSVEDVGTTDPRVVVDDESTTRRHPSDVGGLDLLAAAGGQQTGEHETTCEPTDHVAASIEPAACARASARRDRAPSSRRHDR